MGSILAICPGSGAGKEEDVTHPILERDRDNVVMRGGDMLSQGQCVHCGIRVKNNGISITKYYYLRLQEDGQLVMYTPTFVAGIPMEVIWETKGVKQGTRPCNLKLEMNGNLIIHDAMGEIMWETNSKQKSSTEIPELLLSGKSFGIRVGKKLVWNSARN